MSKMREAKVNNNEKKEKNCMKIHILYIIKLIEIRQNKYNIKKIDRKN